MRAPAAIAIEWPGRTEGSVPVTRVEMLLSAIGLGVFATIVILAFGAYLSPAMLIDFANLRLCS